MQRNAAVCIAACLFGLTVLLAVASAGSVVPGQAWLARNSEAWVLAALFLLDREVVSGTMDQVRSRMWIGLLLAGLVATVIASQTAPGAFVTQRESFAAVLVLAVHLRLTASWRADRQRLLAVVTAGVVSILAALLVAVAWYPAAVGSGVADVVTDYAEAFMFLPLAVTMYDLVYGGARSAAPPAVRALWFAGLVSVPLWVATRPGSATSGPSEFWTRTTEAFLATIILTVWFEVSGRLTSDSSVDQ